MGLIHQVVPFAACQDLVVILADFGISFKQCPGFFGHGIAGTTALFGVESIEGYGMVQFIQIRTGLDGVQNQLKKGIMVSLGQTGIDFFGLNQQLMVILHHPFSFAVMQQTVGIRAE